MTQRPTSVMIYDLHKHFPERHGLMSHLLQHNVYFVNDGSMKCKIDHETWYALAKFFAYRVQFLKSGKNQNAYFESKSQWVACWELHPSFI